uniref:Uncharacterized protein n=1 Tax=Parascaris univalens TaxID=6257 RepID=A0A915BHA4_PARUN
MPRALTNQLPKWDGLKKLLPQELDFRSICLKLDGELTVIKSKSRNNLVDNEEERDKGLQEAHWERVLALARSLVVEEMVQLQEQLQDEEEGEEEEEGEGKE